jgi:peptidoglycan glycosyltransferase
MTVCFCLVVIQLVNVQFVKAPALRASPYNPRNVAKVFDNQRGDIYASNGLLLAKSVPATSGIYHYQRQYPQGPLYSQIVGYDSTYWGTAGIEYQYNNLLAAHTQPAQNLAQVLGFDTVPSETDNVTLTVNPTLQKAAQTALSQIVGANKDAGVVAIIPSTGAIVADYSTPSFDPTPLASTDTAVEKEAGFAYFDVHDSEDVYAGVPLATADTYFPGSTFKTVTTSAVYNLKPSLSNFYFPYASQTSLPNSNKVLQNDGGAVCGGTIATMLPQSCDPGYGKLGIALGAPILAEQAALFGYNSRPPVDLPNDWVATPVFPPVSALNPPNQAFLAYSAIGQYNDRASALSNALVAAGIADGGTIMTPHFMEQVTDGQGDVVAQSKPTVWKQAETKAAAAKVAALMHEVVLVGTASGVGFPAYLDAAVKTGTAQTGNPAANTDDWMIGFAPATNPQIAVAVVVPDQNFVDTGAGIAGPIMKAMLEAAVPPPAK